MSVHDRGRRPGRDAAGAGPDNDKSEVLVAVNRLDEIERIGREVDAFARRFALPLGLVFDVNLALDEVLTNIISYAYDDEQKHQIVVRLRVERDRFVIDVEDDGREFDPLSIAEPELDLPVDERPVGGLGLSLVRRLISEWAYDRRGGWNCLTMTRFTTGMGRVLREGPSFVTEQRDGDVVVLEVNGRLDSAGAAAFEQELLGRIAGGDRHIVVDCENLRYINSAGLRVLLVAAKRLSADGGAIAVAAASGQMRSVVQLVGFDSVFPLCDTVEQARAAVLSARPSPF
jgi:anti-anti-sigma factor